MSRATTEHRWIPVTERLPATDERVLAYASDLGVYVAKGRDVVQAVVESETTTHWMPLPAPPGDER